MSSIGPRGEEGPPGMPDGCMSVEECRNGTSSRRCLKCGAPVVFEKALRVKYSCEVCGLLYEGEADCERYPEKLGSAPAAYIENRMFPWVVVPDGVMVVFDSEDKG